MTTREAAIISAYTGILAGPFEDFHKYVEELMERSVFTHEFAESGFSTTIKELAKLDFIELAKSVGN